MSATVSDSTKREQDWYQIDGTGIVRQPNSEAWNQTLTRAKQEVTAAGSSSTSGHGVSTPHILEAAPIAFPAPVHPQPPGSSQPSAQPTLGQASSNDDAASVLDNSSYSSGDNLKIWDGVSSAEPGSDQKALEKQLNRPLAAAEALSDNWTNWGLDKDISFANPPTTLPPEAQSVIKYVAENPALAAALDTAGSGGGKTDGIIQKSDVDAFIKNAKDQAQKASDTVSSWLKDNPNAGDQSKALVQSAGIIMANQSVAMGADPSFQAGKTNDKGYLTPAGLSLLGQQNPGLSAALGDAGKLWGQSGMFKMIDMAGDDLATTNPDELADAGNIGAWISKGAPTNDVDFANVMNQAALETSVAGIDTSKLGADVFANPQNYTGAQKAAVMVQLGDLQTKIAIGDAEGHWSPGQSELSEEGAGVNPSYDKVQADISQHINQLASDPDVQAYLAETKPSALQSLTNADGSVHDAMQNYFNSSIQTGQALTDDLGAKDKNRNTVSPTDGLETFVSQVGVYDDALGSNGKSMGLMDPTTNSDGSAGPSKLQQFVQNSGQEGNLEQEFSNEIANGKMLSDAIGSGTDLTTALGQYARAAAAYGTALDPTFLAQNAGEIRQNYTNAASDAIFASATPTDLGVAFSDQNGQFDEAKTTSILQQMQQQDPNLFKTSDGQDLTADKIVNLAKQSYDLIRNGVKVQDAFSKVMDGVSAPSGAATDAYKAGTLHLLSALMGGGVLAAKAAEGAHSPTADASIAASAAQVVGTFTEGAAKWGGSVSASLWGANGAQVPDDVKSTIKNTESQGKALGGLGGALSGALSIVSGVGDLKDGDIAGGALNIGSGAAGALAGVAGATEGGASLLSTAGLLSSEVADGIAAGSAALGLAGTAVGVLGALGYGIYEIVEAAKKNDKFTDQVLPTLQQYGITGGPIEPGDGSNGASPPPNIHH